MSLSTLSIDFRGKRFEYFRNIYRAIHCAAGWLIQLNCQAQDVPSWYHGYHIFVCLCWVFRHSGPPLLQESYIFVQRRHFLPSIWSSYDQNNYPYWVHQCSLLVFPRFPIKAYCASILIILSTLGDFGKNCLSHPYTTASLIFLVQWQNKQNSLFCDPFPLPLCISISNFFKWTITDQTIKRKPIYYLLLADFLKPTGHLSKGS